MVKPLEGKYTFSTLEIVECRWVKPKLVCRSLSSNGLMLVTCATARSSRCGLIRILLKLRVRRKSIPSNLVNAFERRMPKKSRGVGHAAILFATGAAVICALQPVICQRLETCLRVVIQDARIRESFIPDGHVSLHHYSLPHIHPEHARYLPGTRRTP